ncbi:MAG: toxin-antitoxin system YwqK family antitoxin [Parachlamydiaceae bacterium]
MKLSRSLCCVIIFGSLTSCQTRQCSDEVVCETVHRYGVALEPEDWSARGRSGQVLSMRKDGVEVVRNYDNGILHGECTYTFPHRDFIQKKEIYDQGCLKEEQLHYTSGLPQQQTVYEENGCQSVTIWYESGAPHAHEKFENGRLIEAKYYSIDQDIDSEVENGQGLSTRRDGQGQLQSVDTIQNGEKVLSTTYHSNGAPAVVTPYVNNMIEGERKTYLPGGEPATIEKWSGNAQNGILQEFEHGELRAEIPFVNDRKHGIERRYRDDGKTLAQEVTWVQGQKHGPTYSYIGNTTKTDWYFRNREVANKSTFDMMSHK